MNFPADLKYTKDHEWIRVEGDVAYVGITVSDLFMPVSGEVLEVNAELEDAPELVNEDAYGKGWLIKISLTDASELEELLSPEDYQKLIAK